MSLNTLKEKHGPQFMELYYDELDEFLKENPDYRMFVATPVTRTFSRKIEVTKDNCGTLYGGFHIYAINSENETVRMGDLIADKSLKIVEVYPFPKDKEETPEFLK